MKTSVEGLDDDYGCLFQVYMNKGEHWLQKELGYGFRCILDQLKTHMQTESGDAIDIRVVVGGW